MDRVELRDRTGRLLGWREVRNGRLEGRHMTGRLCGWYSPRHNETRDAAGRLIGTGDLLATLIVSGT